MGLTDIKEQLGSILEKIIDAEKDAAEGLRVIPPKPFHMVFVGNSGTGAVFFLQSYRRRFEFYVLSRINAKCWVYDCGVD